MYLFPASEFESQSTGGSEPVGVVQDFSRAVSTSAPVGRSIAKRVFDLVMAAGLLLFFAPMMLLVALLVRTNSKGPALFKQRRTGLNGKIFYIYKFRTMTVMEDGRLLPARQKDNRVTPLGSVLRRTSLDELPQLFNVLKGEMSLVGPRPHALAHDARYAALIAGYAERHRVPPGITGWAQVYGHRGETDTLEKMQRRVDHDLFYLANRTLLLDLRILVLTVRTIWRDRNAY